MKVGRRLAIKLLNASQVRAAAGATAGAGAQRHRAARPRAARARSPPWSTEATAAFDAYDYARALEPTETFFWTFCDDYLELVKDRAYGGRGDEPRRRPRAGRSAARPVDAAAPVRAVPAVRHRGGLVVVAGRLGAPRRLADRGRELGRRGPTARRDAGRRR